MYSVERPSRVRRRAFLALSGSALFLAACGGQSSSPSPSSPAGGATSGTAAAGAAAVTQPRGELKVASGFGLANLDATKTGFNLMSHGVGETLTRMTVDLKIEPWLAERVTPVDATTWRVMLRPNATFQDDSPVTAESVVASFKRDWETQPSANLFISKETVVSAVDARTVEFKLPAPNGAFPNNLAAFQFVVHKPGPDNTSIMTGPFKVRRFEPDQQIQLEAFTGHWGGPPAIARLNFRTVTDSNTRVLALQSGDVDMVSGLPAEARKSLPPDIDKAVTPSTRMQYMIMNLSRLPFSDRAVREATSLAIDRSTLNKVGFDGISAPATGILPPLPGVDVVQTQGTDVARARQLLDQAGWVPGGDGVRVKDGRRLALTLYSYPQRADLTPMAISIQSQLKALGYEVQTMQAQDSTKQLESGDWDGATYSVNLLPTGDPLYAYNQTLVKGGDWNFGKYDNPRVNDLVAQMRVEVDAAKRQALSRQIQEAVKADPTNAYLVASPLIFAYKKDKVRNFVPHPSDTYFITPTMSVQ